MGRAGSQSGFSQYLNKYERVIALVVCPCVLLIHKHVCACYVLGSLCSYWGCFAIALLLSCRGQKHLPSRDLKSVEKKSTTHTSNTMGNSDKNYGEKV